MNNKVGLMAVITKVEYAKTDIKMTAALYKVGLEDTEAGHIGEIKIQGPKKEFRHASLGSRFPVSYDHDLSWFDTDGLPFQIRNNKSEETEVRDAVRRIKQTELPAGTDFEPSPLADKPAPAGQDKEGV